MLSIIPPRPDAHPENGGRINDYAKKYQTSDIRAVRDVDACRTREHYQYKQHVLEHLRTPLRRE
jgi:hypothetical protein